MMLDHTQHRASSEPIVQSFFCRTLPVYLRLLRRLQLLRRVYPLAVESIFRYSCSLQAKMLWGLFAFWVSLALAPLNVSSQTAPVTIEVTIGTPLGSSGGGSLAVASLSASGLTSSLVFDQLVLPEAQTASEKTAAPELLQRPRTVGGMFRYEHIHLHQGALNLDGNSYTTNLQLAWDIGQSDLLG